MFELIGLALDTLILLILAAIVGCISAFAAWLIVRRRDCHRLRWIAGASVLPVASAAYLWLCVALLPGESLFGDFSEKLPNGYILTGLGKMPDFSYLEKEGNSYGNRIEPECVERLEVFGDLIAGQYGQRCQTTAPGTPPQECFFVFNTKTGSLQGFKTLLDAESFLHRRVDLVSSESFRSSEPSAILQRRIETAVMIVPPILAAFLYAFWLLRLPRGELRASQSPI